ncbi:MAG TPA: STAS domain-containing protein, partial [Candidatus Angelobacter sp.]|nr:STAS domain-containing protein [Candidatus Angelobacter sp.]
DFVRSEGTVDGSSVDSSVAIEALPDQIVVRLTGEIDIAEVPALDAVVETVEHSHAEVVVDLSRATFIDCSVLGMLARLAALAAARQGRVIVLGAGRTARRAIDLGGLAPAIELRGAHSPGSPCTGS